MLGDGSRGAVIEMTLAKVLYMSSKCRHELTLKTPPEWVNTSLSLSARDDSDHRNERHFGEHQRPAGFSEGGELHQRLQAGRGIQRNNVCYGRSRGRPLF